ncbi:MAG: polysaccharide deacetylase family protein [Candidatus Omnitrophica bacterium]|nr:polysaccharide deacetylase family protein [Candidatus Omnitrophota bacterium]
MEIKEIAKYVCYYLGVPRSLFWLMKRGGPKLLIFTYHKISSDSSNHEYLTVPEDIFEQQIRFIKTNFKPVSMSEGLRILRQGGPSGIYAAINIDDGYMDNYLHAYPVLKKYNMPATIFLTTDYIGKEHVFWWDRVFNVKKERYETDSINSMLMEKGEKERESFIDELEKEHSVTEGPRPCAMLGWNEIREMNNGLISFGAHTKTHRNLCLLGDDEVRRELVDSKSIIEENLGQEVKEFAYPFGRLDGRIRRLTQEAGFKCARTTSGGLNTKDTDRFLLNWIGMDPIPKISLFSVWVASNLFKSQLRSNK